MGLEQSPGRFHAHVPAGRLQARAWAVGSIQGLWTLNAVDATPGPANLGCRRLFPAEPS